MDARELRIGNLIKSGQLTLIVKGIKTGYIRTDCIESGMELTEDPSYFEPIPLTEEILLKAGFEKVKSVLEPVAHKYHLNLKVKGENKNEIFFNVIPNDPAKNYGNYTVNDFWGSNNFTYLHQLQNLIYSLTGEELKIEL